MRQNIFGLVVSSHISPKDLVRTLPSVSELENWSGRTVPRGAMD